MAEYGGTVDRYLLIAGNEIGSKLFRDKNGLCVHGKKWTERIRN
jgi:hypothetical protein